MTDPILTIGLMSGTSRDGIDAALLRSDGEGDIAAGAWLTEPYDDGFRARLAAIIGGRGEVAAVERELTLRHAEAVRRLLRSAGLAPGDVGLCGFHGHTGGPIDQDGALARAGTVDGPALAALLGHGYFARPAPKSLDRDAFSLAPISHLPPADGAATLLAFTAATVARGAAWFPAPAARWLVTGGGRRNPALMAELARRLEAPVAAVEEVGWQGEALEAQAFAYLAVRSRRGLALSVPGTTGVKQPVSGGRYFARPG